MLTDNSIMPFGKYAGQKLANIPASYLIWIFENNKCTAEVARYINENLDVLKEEIKRDEAKRKY
jgi:uncharacterized protein (DUF3820 family)